MDPSPTIGVRHGGDPCTTWAMRIGLLIFVVVLAALHGCAINRENASVSPGVDLSRLKNFYVVKFVPDERGINNLIVTQLTQMGFEASTGAGGAAPTDAEAIVTYQDKWQWDLTMYMLELRVFIREPQTDKLLAAGDSYHTTLSRKSPEEMVAEVLSNIFKEKAP